MIDLINYKNEIFYTNNENITTPKSPLGDLWVKNICKIMNTTFNFSRFLKVLSNEWRLNLKKMLLFWGCMIIIAILYFAFLRMVEDAIPKTVTFGLSFFIMCILQGFYLQIYYSEFSSKTKTQALFLLPASRNETFWAKFLLGVILYLVLFSAYIFIALKWNEVFNDWIKELKGADYRYSEHYQKFTISLMEKLIFFLVWLFSASAYLFGNLTFKKLAAFKSLALWFAIVWGLVLTTCIVYFLFADVWPSYAIPGIGIGVKGSADGKFCTLSQMYPELLYGLGIFICLALIFISRIKYNEKTI